jgi:hypothetical protein
MGNIQMKKASPGLMDSDTPASFAAVGRDGYLGNPDVVNQLIARFFTTSERLFIDKEKGKITKEDFVAGADALVSEMADIFACKMPDYEGIRGFHDFTLPTRLLSRYGSYFAKLNGKWGEYSLYYKNSEALYAPYFEMVFVRIGNHLRTAAGDLAIYETLVSEDYRLVVNAILDREEPL